MWIKQAVVAHITEAQIEKFIRRLNFAHVVIRAIKRIVHRNRKDEKAKLKEIRSTVEKIKEFLRTNIGTTYAEATKSSHENKLSVDMTDWGGQQERLARARAPWVQLRESMRDYRQFVRQEITKLCPWHHWADLVA